MIDGLDNKRQLHRRPVLYPALRMATVKSQYFVRLLCGIRPGPAALCNVVTRSGTTSFWIGYDVSTQRFNSLTASQRADGTRKPVAVENTFGFRLGAQSRKQAVLLWHLSG